MSLKTDRALAFAGAAILIAAIALRLIGLGSALWYDEIVTLVESVRLPLPRLVTELNGVNTHPLYSILAHVSIALFGESAWALRMPAVVFGVASVVMTYVLAARLIGPVEGLAGAAVLATSYHHIWFSQNARGYTMMGFFALAAAYLLMRAWDTNRTRDYVCYALVCAAGVYTHLTMAFVVAGHALAIAVVWLIGTRDRASTARLLPFAAAVGGAALLSALLYAPFIPSLIAHFGAEAPREAAKVATGRWAAIEALRSVLSGSGIVAAIAAGALATIGAFSLWRRNPIAVALWLAPAAVTAAAILVLGQPMRPRFFFFLGGAAAIFVGRGIGAVVAAAAPAIRSRVPAVAICTVVLVAASAPSLARNYEMPKQDFDSAVQYLAQAEAAGATIAGAGPACVPFDIYYDKTWSCLKKLDDLRYMVDSGGRPLIVYTLPDYIDDEQLRDTLLASCAAERRFPGTLGGGDVIVCAPADVSRTRP
jgi:4-amino-4-deoxy-L-arabinose transferase-like glycosyltransferase